MDRSGDQDELNLPNYRSDTYYNYNNRGRRQLSRIKTDSSKISLNSRKNIVVTFSRETSKVGV